MSDDRRGGGRSGQAGGDERAGPDRAERDFGDSAGYGGGGSALDYDEVLGDATSRRDTGKPNPLDAVVHTERSGGDAERSGDRPSDADSTEDLAGPHAKPALTNEAATPGSGALPSEPTGGDVDPGAG
jgi:hypothetical protein